MSPRTESYMLFLFEEQADRDESGLRKEITDLRQSYWPSVRSVS
jgi:hypothetical protein